MFSALYSVFNNFPFNFVAMSSINTCGIGSSMNDPLGSSGIRSAYPRTQYTLGPASRTHITIDQVFSRLVRDIFRL